MCMSYGLNHLLSGWKDRWQLYHCTCLLTLHACSIGHLFFTLALLSQMISHLFTFASLWVTGCWLAAVLFAVCMASAPEATNPLRYSTVGSLHGLRLCSAGVWAALLHWPLSDLLCLCPAVFDTTCGSFCFCVGLNQWLPNTEYWAEYWRYLMNWIAWFWQCCIQLSITHCSCVMSLRGPDLEILWLKIQKSMNFSQ